MLVIGMLILYLRHSFFVFFLYSKISTRSSLSSIYRYLSTLALFVYVIVFNVFIQTSFLLQDMEYLVKNTEHSSLLSRYPSFEDGFCKWFLNQQLFEKSFIDNTCEMT